jgi:hypothetical protein
MYNIYYMNFPRKPGYILRMELKNELDDMFDTSKTTLKERRTNRHKLQLDIENELISANVSLLKKLLVTIKSHNYQVEKHKKYYKNN